MAYIYVDDDEIIDAYRELDIKKENIEEENNNEIFDEELTQDILHFKKNHLLNFYEMVEIIKIMIK